MRARTLLLLTLALSLPLAGCLADDNGEPVDPQGRDGDGGVGGNLTAIQPLVFDGRGVQSTREVSGTYGPGETLLPAGWVNGQWQREVDLSTRVPKGVPTHVNVTVTYQDNAPGFVEMDAILEAEEGELYSYSHVESFSQDTIWLDAVVGLTPGDDLTLVLQGIWPDDGNVEYTASILVEARPDYVPAQVPFEVPVDEDTGGFQITGVGGSPVDVDAMVWGPSDRFLGHVSTRGGPLELNLSPERSVGNYVVVLKSVTPSNSTAPPVVQVRPLQPQDGPTVPPRMRMLKTQVQAGQPHTVGRGETVEWSFSNRPSPIQVGIAVEDPQEVAAHYSLRNDWTVTVQSPNGTVMEFADGDWPPVWFGNRLVYWSDPGHEHLVGGTYDVTFTVDQSTDVDVTELVRTYKR